MTETAEQELIRTTIWADGLEFEGRECSVTVERDESDPSVITLHTYVDGRGSLVSYYWDRENAIALAHELLGAARLR